LRTASVGRVLSYHDEIGCQLFSEE
jgi:hypothetical protein